MTLPFVCGLCIPGFLIPDPASRIVSNSTSGVFLLVVCMVSARNSLTRILYVRVASLRDAGGVPICNTRHRPDSGRARKLRNKKNSLVAHTKGNRPAIHYREMQTPYRLVYILQSFPSVFYMTLQII